MKAQFGPDAIIGIVILVVVSLGGVLFIHIFINSLSLQNVISVVDKEVDQRCLYILIPSIQGEYVHSGYINQDSNLWKTYNYFGGQNINQNISYKFVERIHKSSGELSTLSEQLDYPKISMYGVTDKSIIPAGGDSRICTMNLFNPAGTSGIIGIFVNNIL